MAKKTVFILGAGFSYDAGIPLQAALLKEALTITPPVFTYNNPEAISFMEYQKKLKDFINNLFGSLDNVALEDIFTILDKSVIGKERFKEYSWKELYEYRGYLVNLILQVLTIKLKDITNSSEKPYKKFAEKVIEIREKAGQKTDSLGIISLNWDTLLELSLNKALTDSKDKKCRIDYCAYTHHRDNTEVSHINLKSLGFYNIKVLKLHGSLNWLYCSNCGRLYVDDGNIGIEKIECNYCKSYTEKLYEEPLIITPTMIKELHNLHIKNIWQNAFIEIQEATDIYFIGYSLPYADFEFKYILKKAIDKKSKITVVLSKNDETNGTNKRYQEFLGNSVKLYNGGFSDWISNNNI
ncbi:MAG: hypothetical protein HQK88_04350 [Nitrospirae bacterium]|nr:hypothetical protein [Nitrospirota bacterium]MBF0520909.1 hypothetical protein [Nitrospirota bacterium]MBF0533442.1 hypothetical protein [Nitrospirota bacterium]MBF0616034.1 hypothetical protein [Nitrospirota bacterium]